MAGLDTRLFDETLLEKLAELLSPEGAVERQAHWRALHAEPPSVSGYGIEPIAAPQHCPQCGCPHVREEHDWRSKYVEDIPPIIKTVIEKRYRQGRCSRCNARVVAPQALVGPPVSIGPNLTATLTLLRQQVGASSRKLSRFATDTARDACR